MIYFSAILYLLLFMWFSPPEPTSYASSPRGIFPSYGFDQNDSERLAPILNLIRTGAFRVEENVFGLYKNKAGDTSTFIYEISLSHSGDSVTIEEYPLDKSINYYREKKEIYSVNGKLIYSCSTAVDSSIIDLRYLDINRNVWLNFHSSKKTRFDSIPKDSFFLDEGMKFDEYGKPIEYDKPGLLGKIDLKTFYKYDTDGNEIEEIEYTMIDTIHVPKHPRIIRTQDSSVKAKQAIAVKEWRKKADQWEADYRLMKEEYRLSSKTFTKFDPIARRKETSTYNYSGNDSTLTKHIIIDYDHHHHEILQNLYEKSAVDDSEVTIYKEDSLGHFMTEQFVLNGKEFDSSQWTYNEQGRCISHQLNIPPNTVYTIDMWAYDSKGNLIQYLESRKGEPSYIDKFKIYYK
jgi:hypothetical protein